MSHVVNGRERLTQNSSISANATKQTQKVHRPEVWTRGNECLVPICTGKNNGGKGEDKSPLGFCFQIDKVSEYRKSNIVIVSKDKQ